MQNHEVSREELIEELKKDIDENHSNSPYKVKLPKKQCPFCGDQDEVGLHKDPYNDEDIVDNNRFWYVDCGNCGARGGEVYESDFNSPDLKRSYAATTPREEAIRKWNRREQYSNWSNRKPDYPGLYWFYGQLYLDEPVKLHFTEVTAKDELLELRTPGKDFIITYKPKPQEPPTTLDYVKYVLEESTGIYHPRNFEVCGVWAKIQPPELPIDFYNHITR